MDTYTSVVCDPNADVTSGDETCNLLGEPLCHGDRRFVEYYQRPLSQPDSPWTYVGSGCEVGDQKTGPALTPDLVLSEVRRIGLPARSFVVPPATLVHYDTTVYTESETFARTVDVVGFVVEVRALPSSFRWVYDDGDIDVTSDPGEPYPSKEITHSWLDAHRTFHPRVDTSYSVSYRVDDGPWIELGDAVTVRGDPSRVRIKEATGVLSEMN